MDFEAIGHSRHVPDHFYAFPAYSGHILTTLGHVLDHVQVFGGSDSSSQSRKIFGFCSKQPKSVQSTHGLR